MGNRKRLTIISLFVTFVCIFWYVGFFYYLAAVGYVVTGGEGFAFREVELFGEKDNMDLYRGVLSVIGNDSVYVWGRKGLQRYAVGDLTFFSYIDVCVGVNYDDPSKQRRKTQTLQELKLEAKTGDSAILLLEKDGDGTTKRLITTVRNNY